MNVFSGNQRLYKTSNEEERISRQINSIFPLRTVYAETERKQLANDVRAGSREAFLRDGVTSALTTQEEREEFALILDRLKYGASNVLFHDLAVGIWSALTRPETKDCFLHVTKAVDEASGVIERTTVVVSREGIFKLALGPLVDNNGRSVTGAGPVVDQQKRLLKEVLYGKTGEPMLISSIHQTQDGQKVVVARKPVSIQAISSSRQRELFEVTIDNCFFPVVENGDKLVVGERFLHSVAGMSGVLALGQYILRGRGYTGLIPNVPEAHKIMLFLQAAAECQAFSKDIVEYNAKTGRYNIAARRLPTVKELRPSVISYPKARKPYINYRAFSEFMGSCGLIFLTALQELEIADLLDPRTMIPAIERGAEFPDQQGYENIVYLKADRLSTLIKDQPNNIISSPWDNVNDLSIEEFEQLVFGGEQTNKELGF